MLLSELSYCLHNMSGTGNSMEGNQNESLSGRPLCCQSPLRMVWDPHDILAHHRRWLAIEFGGGIEGHLLDDVGFNADHGQSVTIELRNAVRMAARVFTFRFAADLTASSSLIWSTTFRCSANGSFGTFMLKRSSIESRFVPCELSEILARITGVDHLNQLKR